MGVDAPGRCGAPSDPGDPLFPLDNPALVSVPLGFLAAVLGTFAGAGEGRDDASFSELNVRANTGLGSV